jgi:hypothetical protein
VLKSRPLLTWKSLYVLARVQLFPLEVGRSRGSLNLGRADVLYGHDGVSPANVGEMRERHQDELAVLFGRKQRHLGNATDKFCLFNYVPNDFHLALLGYLSANKEKKERKKKESVRGRKGPSMTEKGESNSPLATRLSVTLLALSSFFAALATARTSLQRREGK